MKYFLVFVTFVVSLSANAAVTDWVDFTLERGHVYLPVSVEGVETKAMLDSGSSVHAINKAFVNKNDLDLASGGKMLIKGVHSTARRSTYNNVKVNLFGADFTLNDVVEFSMGHHSRGLLLGATFFHPFVMQIDYPANKIRLLTRDSVDMNKAANVNSTADKEHGMPIAQIEINGQPLWFLVDTGNSGGIFMERRYASMAGLFESVEGEGYSSGVNSSGIQEVATAKTVQFGPFEISDVKVRFPAPGETTNLESQYSTTSTRIKGKRIAGILGFGLFKDFLLTIDYQTGKIHVALPES